MSKPTNRDFKSLPGYETKDFAPITASIDEDQGVVDAIVAVMGNIDAQGDVIMPGAFAKTIVERGQQVLVLDSHRIESTDAILAKIQGLREITAGELPAAVVVKYPEASGALLASMKFVLTTQSGHDAFELIKAGAVNQYSIGYDPMQKSFETIGDGDNKQTVRKLHEIRLWEVSVCPFAANSATMTVSAKAADSASAETDATSETKPWRVAEREGEYCVFKLDADGNLDGEPLKCYESEEDAATYARALYANVEDAETADKGANMDQEQKEGRVLSSRNAQRIAAALASLIDTLENAGLDVPRYAKDETEEEPKSIAPAVAGRADDSQNDEKAGPGTSPPTNSDMLAQLQVLELEISLLEVT